MERHYETICIVKPDIGEEAIKGIVSKSSKLVEELKGIDVVVDEWGRRKLAYPIEKKNEGFYFILTYTGPDAASKELERTFRINEDVMRFQTVRLKERVAKPEEVKPEEVTTEEAKPEEAKTEEAKTEETKTEAVKTEETKPEAVKTEETKTEETKPEEVKTEETKAATGDASSDLNKEGVNKEEKSKEDVSKGGGGDE